MAVTVDTTVAFNNRGWQFQAIYRQFSKNLVVGNFVKASFYFTTTTKVDFIGVISTHGPSPQTTARMQSFDLNGK